MKKILILSSLFIFLLGQSVVAQSLNSLETFLVIKNVMIPSEKPVSTSDDSFIEGQYWFGTISYGSKKLGSYLYETYGRANTLGHPIIREYKYGGVTLVHLSYMGENEMRANTVSRDRIWIINDAGESEEFAIAGKTALQFKYDGEKIQFLSTDHPHSFYTYVYILNPANTDDFSCDAYNLNDWYAIKNK